MATYQSVKEGISKAIQRGRYSPGDRVGPLRTLSEEFESSIVTVDRAVRELAREGVLVREPNRGFYVSSENRTIKGFVSAIIATLRAETSFPNFLNGVEQSFKARRYQVSLCTTQNDLEQAMAGARWAVQTGSQGVIYVPVSGGVQFDRNREVLEYLSGHNIPVAIAGHCRLEGTHEYSNVTSAHRRGGYEMARHLLGRGLRRIALLGAVPNQDHLEIIEGYKQALAEYGVSFDERDLHFLRPDEQASVLAKKLFAGGNRPEAMFCLADGLAGEAMLGLAELGLSVPDDAAVVGFGDFPICRYLPVPLTTVRVRHEEEGHLLANMLIDRIEGSDGPARHIEVPCDLVVRKSCGAGREVAAHA